MKDQIKHWFSAPIFEGDEEKTWRASLINVSINICAFIIVLVVIGNLMGGRTQETVFVLDAVMLFVLFLIRRILFSDRVKLAGFLLIAMGIILVTAASANLGTVRTPTTTFLLLFVIFAGLLFGQWGVMLSTIAGSMAVLGLILAENAGMLPRPDYVVTITQWVSYTVAFVLTGTLIHFSYQSTKQALEQAYVEMAERKSAHEAYENLVNYSLQGFAILQDEKIVFANPEIERMSGYTRGELYALTPEQVFALVSEEDREELLQTIRACMVGEELPEHAELRIIRKDGEIRWLESFNSVINYRDRPAMQSAYLDITDRKQAEEQLRKLSRAVEAAPVSIVITDKNGIIEYANPFFSALTGYEKEEALGKNPRVLRSYKTPSETYSELWKTILNGRTWQGEFVNKKKNGELYIESAAISPVFDKDGHITHFVAIKRDITVRKLLEQKLQESEERFRLLFDDSADAYLILDENIFIECNRAAVEMMRANTKEEMLFVHPSVLSPDFQPDGQPSFEKADEMIRRALEQGSNRYEWMHRRMDGEDFPVEVLLTPITVADKTIVHAVLRDITERKHAEEREQEQRTLAEALRDTAEALISSLNLDEILAKILDKVGEVVKYDAISIIWINERKMRFAKLQGFESEQEQWLKKQSFTVDEFIIFQQVVENKKPIVISDTKSDPRWVSLSKTSWIHSHIEAPVIVGGNVVAIITLDSKERDFYTEAHARNLQAFASQVAIAIQNATLFEEVQNLATLDDLTGLYNRRGFFEICQREIGRLQRYNRPTSVLFVDIDHFKRFNDHYSYEIGDRVLQQVAELLKSNAREIDVICRYGGEEMVLLLPEINQAGAVETAERLRSKVESLRIPSDHGGLKVTVSIGVATLVPVPAQTIPIGVERQAKILNDLIADAGEALHVAKHQGRNRISVYREE